MTESTIYWITRLDGIRRLLEGSQVIFAFIAGVGILWMLASAYVMAEKKPHVCEDDEDRCEDDEDYNRAKAVFVLSCKFSIPTVIMATMCMLACIFVPTTKEMMAIKAIPAIASSEQASRLKDIGDDAIDFAAEWLKSQIKAREGETDGSK